MAFVRTQNVPCVVQFFLVICRSFYVVGILKLVVRPLSRTRWTLLISLYLTVSTCQMFMLSFCFT